jgi:tetratricopeptide (TPR) repeat protein
MQRKIGDHAGEAVTLINQGELIRTHGDYEQARQNFETALQILQQHPDQQARCTAYHNLGLLSHQEHDYRQAYQCYTEALKSSELELRPQTTGMILTNLGMLFYEQRRHQEALALLFVALQLRQNSQDPTTPLLERFLVAIEQKMGTASYTKLSKDALSIQAQVLSRFIPANMRQYL